MSPFVSASSVCFWVFVSSLPSASTLCWVSVIGSGSKKLREIRRGSVYMRQNEHTFWVMVLRV